ncbi:hypothetical protein ACFL0Q_09250 [Thermodesulfobacteriota bacterium]
MDTMQQHDAKRRADSMGRYHSYFTQQRSRSPVRFLPFLLLCLVFCGCSIRPALTPREGRCEPKALPDPEVLVSLLRKMNAEPTTFSGVGRIRISRNSGTENHSIAWLGSRPDRLRMELLDPFRRPVATLIIRGDRFFLDSKVGGESFRGHTASGAINKLLGISVPPEELVTLLSGRIPLALGRRGRVFIENADPDEKIYLLVFTSIIGAVREKVWISGGTDTALGYEKYGFWGTKGYEVRFSGAQSFEGVTVPEQIAVLAETGAAIRLTVHRFQPNVEVSDEQFMVPGNAGEAGSP